LWFKIIDNLSQRKETGVNLEAMSLIGKTVLITGGALRIGRSLALLLAQAGADIVLHYGKSRQAAESAQAEIQAIGRKAYLLQADLESTTQAATLISRAWEHSPLFALVNNASVFEISDWQNTSLEKWNRALSVNLTAPFLLSQAFANSLSPKEEGRIVNLLDWRALRPGREHLAYTVSNSALAALTRSLAITLAPRITVNGLALGAILPPSDGMPSKVNLEQIPARRWATLEEVGQALLFLLDGPAYITGEFIHVDGGRHLI
jgi:NAD(P)-dependent dehydrogenase (short-subunit alcohol dehydrogenase family)